MVDYYNKPEKMEWTVILYRGDNQSQDTHEMCCPTCGHHLLNHNAVAGVISDRSELDYLIGARVNVLQLKCAYCKSDFTVIYQDKE